MKPEFEIPTRKSDDHKWSRRFVKGFLTFGIILGLLGIIHNIHIRLDPTAERVYGRLVHVRFADRDFAIPSEYFRGPLPPRLGAPKLYLWLTLPDYQPYLGEFSEGKNPMPVSHRLLMLMIEDTAITADLAIRYDMARKGPASIFDPKDEADRYGLHRTSVYYSNQRSPEPFVVHDLYYVDAAPGNVTAFISCGRDAVSPQGASCNHDFQDGRLIYNIGYGKENLPQWREIQYRVQNLVKSFHCRPIMNQTILTQNISGETTCPP